MFGRLLGIGLAWGAGFLLTPLGSLHAQYIPGASRPAGARFDDAGPDGSLAAGPPDIAADAVARIGLVESAFGSPRHFCFAGLTGTAVSNSADKAQAGLLVGGSPLDRLTLHALIGRDAAGHFSPRLTGQLRILGDRAQRFAIGALAQYKAEGFTEAGGEAEIGFLATHAQGRDHITAWFA